MQKRTKLLLAAATLWPFVYIFIFIFFFVFTAFLPSSAREGTPVFGGLMIGIFALHLLTMLLGLALTVFYIVNVFRNERVQKDQKALWAVVIFLGSMFAMPIYWYLYIWKEPAIASPSSRGQLNSVDSSAWTSNARSSQREEQYVPPRQPPDWR